jgi:sialidase-1
VEANRKYLSSEEHILLKTANRRKIMEIKANAEHGIVNRVKNSLFTYQGWPSVCRDENGTLYAVASSFRLNHICPFGKTAMYISRNNGETWTPPIVINDTYLDDRDAGIVYLGKGRLLVTWFSHPTSVYMNKYFTSIKNSATPIETGAVVGMLGGYPYIPESESLGGSFIRISEDYGVTWGETIKIPVSAPHGPNLLRDGTLIYLGKELYSNGEAPKDSICAYRSDNGRNWERISVLGIPEGTVLDNFHEPHVIELPDGRLFGAIRAQGKNIPHGFSIYTTLSEDRGRSWSDLICSGVSGSPPHLMLHSSGALICTYGRREPPFGERAMVSYDYGATWQDEYIIDERVSDSDLGYPASVELDDGSILTVYYQKFPGDSKCSILYSKWKLK